jgi:acyl transferase domain-containing protein/pimeloyl-ACP methyl ester carboxylesterase
MGSTYAYGEMAIAITGMACRFPGADDPEAFWTLLREGRSAVRHIEQDRLRAAGVPARIFGDPAYVPAVAEIDGIDLFDAASFGISDREAALIDPQQRILLECALHALEDAGRARESDGLKTGVFVGVGINGYLVRNLRHMATVDDPVHAFEVLIGSDKDYAASRIAYRLGLTGPAVNVNTACSTSLVCVYQAMKSLLAYDCDVALAGACKLNVPAGVGYLHRPGGIMSVDGRCRAFDAEGTGTVFGSGAGALVLRRLRDALEDGDRIHAVILAGAVNNDGARKVGFVAPSVLGQSEVIAEALAVADIDAGRIGYVEAHGTGTALGDPIEIAALERAFRRTTQRTGDCPIGSVKTNIGHLEAAAGMAGLIKVVLSLRNETIPPSLHFDRPNPQIDFARSPFQVNTAPRPWPRGDAPRLAGVSSFGIGGTNAHLIVADPPLSEAPAREPAYSVLALTAEDDDALARLRERMMMRLRSAEAAGEADDTIDLCHTTQAGARHRAVREAIVAASRGELLERLQAATASPARSVGVFRGRSSKSPRVAMLFGGQGSRYPGMARGLYRDEPAFRERMDRADACYRRLVGRSLIADLWDADGRAMASTAVAQPALFAVQVALAQTFIDRGVRPHCVAGHSVGEFAAACIAGMFDIETGLRLLVERGSEMADTREGRMVAVDASESRISGWLDAFSGDLAVAARNGPDQIVLSGTQQAVDVVLRESPDARLLAVDRAFHSPLMREVPARLRDVFVGASLAPPKIAFVTAGREGISPDRPEYWLHQIVDTVEFSTILDRLAELDPHAVLDITPLGTLAAIAARHPQLGERPLLRCLDPRRAEPACFADALAQAFALGAEVDWRSHLAHLSKRRVPLPAYPFDRRRHWIDPPDTAIGPFASPTAAVPLRDVFELRWREAAAGAPIAAAESAQRRWLVLGGGALAPALVERLSAVGLNALAADTDLEAALSRTDGAFSPPFSVIDLRPLDFDSEALAQRDDDPVEALAPIVSDCLRALAMPESRLATYWLVTAGAQATTVDSDIEPLGSALWGLGRTVAREHPHRWGGLIDLRLSSVEQSAEFVFAEVTSGQSRVEVANVGGVRLQPELVRLEVAERPCALRADATYLIVGGLGGLGLAVARHFASLGARHLVLGGRSASIERDAGVIAEFAARGVCVRTIAVDIGVPEQVRGLIAQIAADGPPLAGIVHAAGALQDRLLRDLDWPTFAASLSAKIVGTSCLDRETRGMPLEFMLLFSSITGVFGSPGQAAYATANAWLDGFAARRHARGARTLIVDWGPWSGAGMAGRLDAWHRARIQAMGLAFIEPAPALALLSNLLASGAHRAIAFALDANADIGALPAVARAAIAGAEAAMPPSASPLSALLALPSAERREWMQRHLAELLSRTLGMPSAGSLSHDADLVDLGMNSLIAMDLIRALRDDFGLMIYPREIYEHRSLRAFADYVLSQMSEPSSAQTAMPALPQRERVRSVRGAPAERLDGVVFVLSAPRSGSTLLRAMLAGHSRLFAPPELHLLPFESMREREQALASTHLGEGLQRAIMELLGTDAASAGEVLREMVVDDHPTHRVYAWLIERAGGRLLVDKSPTYGLERATLERAERLFLRPHYVHLTRHPQAMIESFARIRMHKLFPGVVGDAQAVGETVWRTCNGNIADFLAGVDPDRHCRVAYEDLVRAPMQVLAAVGATLELDPEPAMLEPYGEGRMNDGIHAASLPIGDPNFGRRAKIDGTLAERWRDSPQWPIDAETLALCATLGYAQPAPREAPLPLERDYRCGDFRLALSEWGRRDGPAVLCIHGAMEHGHTWRRLAEQLAAHGLRVLAPDLRGHGLSDHQRLGNALSMQDWLFDLDALLEEEDLRDLQLIGHSMGSLLAASLAALRPERIRAVALIEPILPAATAMTQRLGAQLKVGRDYRAHERFLSPEEAVDRLSRLHSDIGRDDAETLALRGLIQCESHWSWRWDARLSARAFAVDADRDQYLALLTAIDRHVTVIRGMESPFAREADVRALDGALMNRESHLLPGAHHPHLRSADAVARILLTQRRKTSGGAWSVAQS